ncbi:putative cerevisin [Clavispora lusitaniae]|uniref:Cerevisin n=1 Tax=Clavispora lusitaniae TaxID=36911 RepID=A0AA91Q3U8_CLALS|nr:putative cerevisin [Clavispora lusitaniae]
MQLQLLLPLLVAQQAAALVLPNLNLFDFPDVLPISQKEESLDGKQKPLLPPQSTGSKPTAKLIPNKYIVVLKEGLSQQEIAAHHSWATETLASLVKSGEDKLVSFSIDAFNGYSAYMPPAFVEMVKKLPVVDFVEQDSVMHVNEFDVQKDAPWGLARVSQRELTTPSVDYFYDTEGGKGVTAYIIDTGIKTEHPDFEGRAVWGDAIAFPKLKVDAHGHGSHVAGTIGSKTYGIAKNVDLVAIGVMNLLGSGTTSDIIKGVEFAAKDHQSKLSAKQKGYKGATVNMSIGGGASDALDLAVNAGINAGLHIAVAAGNEDQDACEVSPARALGPITVGATDNADGKASFSNWGSCVDIQAPGVDILSVGIWSDTMVMSGTSMAAPHITGLLSYYLSLQPDLSSEFSTGLVSPQELKRRLIRYGTKNVVSGLDAASPNVLAFNGAGGNITDFWK